MNSSHKVVLITAITLSAVAFDYWLTRPAEQPIPILTCCDSGKCDLPCGGSGGGGIVSISPDTCDAGYELVVKITEMGLIIGPPPGTGQIQTWCARDLKYPHEP